MGAPFLVPLNDLTVTMCAMLLLISVNPAARLEDDNEEAAEEARRKEKQAKLQAAAKKARR